MRGFSIGTRDAKRRESVWQSLVKRGRSGLVAGDPPESAEVDWECLALGWSPFGVEDLNPEGQVAQVYKLFSGFLPQLSDWQAAGKARSLLVLDREKPQPVSLGGYKITLTKPRTPRAGGAGAGTSEPS